MTITIIAASSRKNSNSLRFSKYLKHVLNNHKLGDIQIVDFENCDIPTVGRGVFNPEELTDFQQDMITKWKQSDIVFFAVPEYNWSTNGEFINALHQLGTKNFVHLFDNKIFSVVGVSSGRGGKSPALETIQILNKIISFTNQYSIVSPKLFESHDTVSNINDDLVSSDNEMFVKGVNDFVHYTLQISDRWFK